MNRFFAKAIPLCTAAAMSFALAACDDDEIAAGVAGAAIGAGAAIIIDRANDGDNCRPGYRTVCSNSYDYFGNQYRDCRQVRYRCINRNAIENSILENGRIDVRARAAAAGMTVEDFAQEYKLTFEGAERLWAALEASDQGNSAPLKGLGLSSGDIQLLGQYKQPSEAGIDALARNLNTRADLTAGMLNRIRAWALTEKTRICAQPDFKLNQDELRLCNRAL